MSGNNGRQGVAGANIGISFDTLDQVVFAEVKKLELKILDGIIAGDILKSVRISGHLAVYFLNGTEVSTINAKAIHLLIEKKAIFGATIECIEKATGIAYRSISGYKIMYK